MLTAPGTQARSTLGNAAMAPAHPRAEVAREMESSIAEKFQGPVTVVQDGVALDTVISASGITVGRTVVKRRGLRPTFRSSAKTSQHVPFLNRAFGTKWGYHSSGGPT